MINLNNNDKKNFWKKISLPLTLNIFNAPQITDVQDTQAQDTQLLNEALNLQEMIFCKSKYCENEIKKCIKRTCELYDEYIYFNNLIFMDDNAISELRNIKKLLKCIMLLLSSEHVLFSYLFEKIMDTSCEQGIIETIDEIEKTHKIRATQICDHDLLINKLNLCIYRAQSK